MAVVRTGLDLGWVADQDVTSLLEPALDALPPGSVLVFDHSYVIESTPKINVRPSLTLAGGAAGSGLFVQNYVPVNGLPLMDLQDGVTLLDLTIQFEDLVDPPLNNNGFGVQVTGDNVVFDNCNIKGGIKELVRIKESSGHIFRNNKFEGGFLQIGMTVVQNMLFEGNLFYNSTGDGIKTAANPSINIPCNNITVDGNIFLNNDRDGIDTTGGWRQCLVTNSYFVRMGVAGLDLKTSPESPAQFEGESNDDSDVEDSFFLDCNRAIVHSTNDRGVDPSFAFTDANYLANCVRNMRYTRCEFNKVSNSNEHFLHKGVNGSTVTDCTNKTIDGLRPLNRSVDNGLLSHLTIETNQNITATNTPDSIGTEAQGDEVYIALAGYDASRITYENAGVPLPPSPILLSYTKGGTNPVRDTAVPPNEADDFVDQVVVNNVTPVDPTVTAREIDGTPVITVNGSGDITVTINSGPYAGIYTQDIRDGSQLTVAAVEAAPVPYIAGSISGNVAVNSQLEYDPIKWLVADTYVEPDDPTFVWQNDTDGSTGETTELYSPTPDDLGDTLSVDETYSGITISSPSTVAVGPATPDAIADVDWSLATGVSPNTIDLTIMSLPSDNGSAITGAQYRVDGGTPTAIPGYAGTGTYPLTMEMPTTSYNIEIRFSNVNGDGGWSNIKNATSAALGGYNPFFSPTAKSYWDASDTDSITATGNDFEQIDDPLASAQHLVDLSSGTTAKTGLYTVNALNVIRVEGGDYPGILGGLELPANSFAIHGVFSINAINDVNNTILSLEVDNAQFGIQANDPLRFEGTVQTTNGTLVQGGIFQQGPASYSGLTVIQWVFDTVGKQHNLFVNGINVRSPGSEYAYSGFSILTGNTLRWGRRSNGSAIGMIPNLDLGELIIESNITNRENVYSYLTNKWGTP